MNTKELSKHNKSYQSLPAYQMNNSNVKLEILDDTSSQTAIGLSMVESKETNINECVPVVTNEINSVEIGKHTSLYDKLSSNYVRRYKRNREPSRVSLKFCKKILHKKKIRLMCIKTITKIVQLSKNILSF